MTRRATSSSSSSRTSKSTRKGLSLALVAAGCVLLFTDGGLVGYSRSFFEASAFRRRLTEAGILERPHACAAFSICGDPCDQHRADTCTEAIGHRADSVERIDGPAGSQLAVLKSNPTYRVKDVLDISGTRYRLDSMTILGEPRYRGTLLRETLIRTSKYD